MTEFNFLGEDAFLNLCTCLLTIEILTGNVEIWPTGRKRLHRGALPHLIQSQRSLPYGFLVQCIFAQLQGICLMCITGDNDDSLFMASVLLSQCLWRALERALCCVAVLPLISSSVCLPHINPVFLLLAVCLYWCSDDPPTTVSLNIQLLNYNPIFCTYVWFLEILNSTDVVP